MSITHSSPGPRATGPHSRPPAAERQHPRAGASRRGPPFLPPRQPHACPSRSLPRAERAGLGDAQAISHSHEIQQAPTGRKGTLFVAFARRSQRSSTSSLAEATGLPNRPGVAGWIQLVVATPEVEELLCRGETGRGVVPLRLERVGVDIRLRGGGSIGSGSGRRSLEVHRARRRRSRRVCCRALVSGGFVRVAGCRLWILRRCRGVICRSSSGRRSRFCSRVVLGCERSRVGSVVRRRRSRESCNAMPRSDVAALNIEPRPPRGMLSVALNVPSRRSSR